MRWFFFLIAASASLFCAVYIGTYSKFDREISFITKTVKDIYNELKDRRLYEMQEKKKIPRVNLAQDTLGGRVMEVSGELLSTPKCSLSFFWDLFGLHCCPACRILSSGQVSSGDCVAFRGTQATFVIKLYGFAHIDAISIEHIDPSQSPGGEISSAPRDFSLMGVPVNGKEDIFLASFSYTHPGETLQVFQLSQVSSSAFNMVKVTFTTNHGNPDFTCLYRVRIHGELQKGVA